MTLQTQIVPTTIHFPTAHGSVHFWDYHVELVTEDGGRYRHYFTFPGYERITDDDGDEVILRRPAHKRAAKLKARIDAAIAINDIYALDPSHWTRIEA